MATSNRSITRSGALHLSMKHHSAFHLIWSSVHYCVLCVSNSANIRKYYELYSIMYIFTSMHIICQIVAKLMTLQHLEICIKRSNADDQHMLSCSFFWFDQFKLRVLYYTKHFSIQAYTTLIGPIIINFLLLLSCYRHLVYTCSLYTNMTDT